MYASDRMRLDDGHAAVPRLLLLAGAIGMAAALCVACASLSGLSGSTPDGGVDGGHLDATTDGRKTGRDTGSDADADRAEVGQQDVHEAGPPSKDVAVEAACTHAYPVTPPSQVSSGSKSVSFAVAVERYTSGVTSGTDDGGPVGFDLDHQCTCPGPPSCNSPSMSQNCDVEPGGHDVEGNSLGALLDSQLAGTSAGDLNTRIAHGRYSIVLVVQSYNGGANDSDVFVGLMTSSGLDSDGGTPQWDGSDVWNIDPASTIGTAADGDAGNFAYTPRYYVTDAYVNNYVLVASFSSVVVGLSLGVETMNNAILSATIGQTASGQYTLTGQIAGRITTASAFGLIAHLGYEGDGGEHKLCGTDPLFLALQQSVCSSADIMGQQSQDSTDAGCNALSFGIGFESVQVGLGKSVATQYNLAGCDGGVTDCP